MEKDIEEFLASCDDLITCKFLVAEYKIQKLLQQLANTEEVCSLVGECLEQFNRDREFSKAFIQDGHGDFMCDMPKEEYKIIALVFCTLIDIDNKKIEFTDFVKRFFGRDGNAFESFIKTMIVPFRNLIADAFGYSKIKIGDEETKEDIASASFEEYHDESEQDKEEDYDESEEDADNDEQDEFILAQKVAVQILSELQYLRQDYNIERATKICRSIVKTTDLKDEDITSSLIFALKELKIKPIKFMVKELLGIFDL